MSSGSFGSLLGGVIALHVADEVLHHGRRKLRKMSRKRKSKSRNILDWRTA
jgi:hypothetical protein